MSTPLPTVSELQQGAEAPGISGATEEDIRLFIGPRADRYMTYFRNRFLDPGPSVNLSWHWGAALFPVPWVFYRKLYLFGFGLILLPVIGGILVPRNMALPLGGLSLAIFCALLARRGYIDHALRCIRRIDALGLPPEERRARIKKAGGVSYLAGGLASLFWTGMASLPFLLLWMK